MKYLAKGFKLENNIKKPIDKTREREFLIKKNYDIFPDIYFQVWENNGNNFYRKVEADFEIKNGFPINKETVFVYDDKKLVFHYDNGIKDVYSKYRAVFNDKNIIFAEKPKGTVKLVYIKEEDNLTEIEGIAINNKEFRIEGLNNTILYIIDNKLHFENNVSDINKDIYFYIKKVNNDYVIYINDIKYIYCIKDNPIVKIKMNKSDFFGYHTKGKYDIQNLI